MNTRIWTAEDIVYNIVDLKTSGGSKEMNVDGSSADVEFLFVPQAGETWFLSQIGIFILDPGDMSNTNFGSIAPLTNGVEVCMKIGPNEYAYNTLKDNVDVLMAFPEQGLVGATSTGFLSDEDYYMGLFKLPTIQALHGDDADHVCAHVRDDLTAIGRLRMNALLLRPV